MEGHKEAALYDVHGRRIFIVDERAHRLLRRCEANEPLDGRLDLEEWRLLQTLAEEGLGTFETDPPYVEKLLLRRPVEWKGWSIEPPQYYRLDWVITDKCDAACAFCRPPSQSLTWQACQTCLPGPESTDRWEPPSHTRLVEQFAGLGFRLLHVRGGNPLLVWETLVSIAEAVRGYPSLSLIVTTPGTGRPVADLVSLSRDYGVRLNIVFFGIRPGVSGSVGGNMGLFEYQVNIIDSLIEAGTPVFLTLLLNEETLPDLDATLEFAARRWGGIPSVAEMRSRMPEGKKTRLHQVRLGTKPLVPWRSAEEFFLRIRNNTCNAGNLELGLDGKIRPCAGINRECGDLARDGAHLALSMDELFEVWRSNKASIEPCRACPLRFACADCSVFEIAGAEDPEWKEAYCPHNPNSDGVPAYERTWSPGGFVRSLRS